MLPLALTQQPQIDAAVRQVTEQLHPDVQHVRWEIEKDWSDQWAIYFRVVLSDEAGNTRLREVATNVIGRLAERLDFPALGVSRTVSEQAALQEEAWA